MLEIEHFDLKYYKRLMPFRSGVLICQLRFGSNHTLSHGFSRIIDWIILDKIYSDDSVILKFKLSENNDTLKLWNHKFDLILFTKLSDKGVEMQLDINTDIETTGIFDSYIYVNNIHDYNIQNLGTQYIDQLDNNIIKNNNDNSLYIDKNSDEKTMNIEHINNSDIVIWNPWIKRSKILGDMQGNDYQNMVCIEISKINNNIKKKDYIGFRITKELK